MKVFAARTRYTKGEVESVQWTDFDPCCPEAKTAWNRGFIRFGERDTTLNHIERACVYSCLPYPEGAVWDSMPINFCPFCAAPIVLTVTG